MKLLVALLASFLGVITSLGLHRYRLPDFTLDIDPSFSPSLRFRVSRTASGSKLTTTVFRNLDGRRKEAIATHVQRIGESDTEQLAASMRKISFAGFHDASSGRDGETCRLSLDSFPFVGLTCWTPMASLESSGLVGVGEIERQLLNITREIRQAATTPNEMPEPSPAAVTSSPAREPRQS